MTTASVSLHRLRRRVRRKLRPLRHWLLERSAQGVQWACRHATHAQIIGIARFLGRAGYSLLRRQRKRALAHLRIAFGESLSTRKRRVIARESFQSVTATVLEAIHSRSWSEEYFREIIEVEGDQHWQDALRTGQGSVFVTAHFGNWELTPAAFRYHSGITVGVIMRDVKNATVNSMVREARGARGIPIYTTQNSALVYLRRLKSGGIVSMLGDLDSKHLRGMHAPFFGRESWTAVGPAFLARRTGASLVPAFIHRRSDDPTRHVFRFRRPVWRDMTLSEEEDIRRMLSASNRALEAEIRQHPSQWAWMQRRWKRAL